MNNRAEPGTIWGAYVESMYLKLSQLSASGRAVPKMGTESTQRLTRLGCLLAKSQNEIAKTDI